MRRTFTSMAAAMCLVTWTSRGAGEANPSARLSPKQCAQLRQSVERQLAAAQRCKSDGACEVITFEYAFRPCGESVRTGASLDRAKAGAQLYRERCNPVIRPVRCAYRPRAVCDHGRCTLAGPAEK